MRARRDIGQRRDPTAIAVVEATERETGRVVHDSQWHDKRGPLGFARCAPAPLCREEIKDHFDTRQLGRLPLGTPYDRVAVEIADVVKRLNARDVSSTVRLDVTGVGRPVYDLVADHVRGLRCGITAATFVAGDQVQGGWGSTEMRVGKARMVSRLQVLLAERRIMLPAFDRQARVLARELETYEIRVNDNAHLAAGAFSTGAHDDLVTALGLAVLLDPTAGRIVRGPKVWR